MVKCLVCEVSNCPYKCPKCLLPYCSVACFKHHKESCTRDENKRPFESAVTMEDKPDYSSSPPPKVSSVNANKVSSISVENSTPSSIHLTDELKTAITSSKDLNILLCNNDECLKSKIVTILDAPDPEAALRKALVEDPEGVGKVATIIYSLIDQ